MFTATKTNWNIIVIGGAQAGLATGYFLKKLNEDFIILDGAERIGDSWRNRWDSLELFTPNWANNLPGFSFPGNKKQYATKDQVADYLESYARKFALPVQLQTRVNKLSFRNGEYEIGSSRGQFTARQVIIANGGYNVPRIPSFCTELDPSIQQIHSGQYKRPADLPAGDVLVVGAATSGLQIALDLAGTGRKIYVSGHPPAAIPPFLLKYFGPPLIWMMNNILTRKTVPGRKAAIAMNEKHQAAPLINISLEEVTRAGVVHLDRVTGTKNGFPQLRDGQLIKPKTIIWCTGYAADFSWVQLNNIVDDYGNPRARRGISGTQPGLYFVGMKFQFALTSSWIRGVGRDAAFVANTVHEKGLLLEKQSGGKQSGQIAYRPAEV